MLTIATVLDFMAAIGIGLLLGLEREKHKKDDEKKNKINGTLAIGEIRTFILLAIMGAAGGWLTKITNSPVYFSIVLLIMTALMVTGYILSNLPSLRNVSSLDKTTNSDSAFKLSAGITTETAGLVTCLLAGTATLGYKEIAIGLAILAGLALAYKKTLHTAVNAIGWSDVHAILRLSAATFLILPLLPHEAIDPFGAIKPYSLWLLVILISTLSLIGYAGSRLFGPTKGIVKTPTTNLTV